MNKESVVRKVLTHCMGAYDLVSGEFENKTKPLVKKLEKQAQTVEELVERLLESNIFLTQVVFSQTNEKWDVIQEPLMVFLADRTHWNFLLEGFIHHLQRTEIEGSLSSVLFMKAELDEQRKAEIRQWLLGD